MAKSEIALTGAKTKSLEKGFGLMERDYVHF